MREQQGYELNRRQRSYLPVKRLLDIGICIPVCVILAPFMLVCAVAVKLDTPGPVLFKQKRIGKDRTYFYIWKFRTMRVDAPKNVPTHLLANPETYITRTGRFMRLHSIDELPQIYQCLFTDSLSLVGPRPALWNQEDLVEEREKYGANSVKPGITGWAQINGRDELEIPVKARLDGEYIRHFGFAMDVRCFFGTFIHILRSDGVVEGGTGGIKREARDTRQ
ncbi:MAG: sugar transferase [Muribaculaceae bacterium]|nr:sugar transferase [Roseburia sp.]MCM1432022.1 sugar transferase [Muribaculaceae bacterium]MCM1493725.1 sugar transferase [Muribaculaceae bacterium]